MKKRVQIFAEQTTYELEAGVNSWLSQMEDEAKKQTDGNVDFVLHGIQMAAAANDNSQSGQMFTALAIYSYTI